jgi:predicted RNA-binding protein with PIN domain
MAYLIDGNNLLGRISREELKDRRGRDGLIVRLLAFQKVIRRRIFLVFDGKPEGEPGEVRVNDKFTIHYPAEGSTADDVIKELLDRQTDKRNFFVVSSDRDIKDFARARGIGAISSDEFFRELQKALRERKKQREMEKRVNEPSSLEIRLWDEVFKDKT